MNYKPRPAGFKGLGVLALFLLVLLLLHGAGILDQRLPEQILQALDPR